MAGRHRLKNFHRITCVAEPKVLVVDDEENIRHMLALLLKKEGYVVRTAVDGAEALAELEKSDFDTIVCDLRMPVLDGHGFLAALKERRVSTTVIVMSAYADIDDALRAIKGGAYDYIAKPFKRDEILFTLRKAAELKFLREENVSLRAVARGAQSFEQVIARSPPMLRVFDTVRKVADYKSTVILSGESGTGKEMIARALHSFSARSAYAFVAINCGAIPEHLLESELFGHVRGAFTDASRDKNGLFQEADKGTIFLDEIGDMPLNLQVKLLRVLQEGEVRRVGDTRSRPIDVRVVAASVHDLSERARAGAFREDLFYRLNVLPIHLPPLRQRKEDIPLLVEHFVARYNEIMRTDVRGFTPQAMAALTDHAWPGNVRELENVVERAMVLTESSIIGIESLPESLRAKGDDLASMLASDLLSIKKANRTLEITLIRRALEKTNGNRTAAARILEISHRALLYKIKEYFGEGEV